MKNNKGAIEFSMTSVIIVILGIIILGLIGHWVGNWIGESSWNEQNYCKNNPSNCEFICVKENLTFFYEQEISSDLLNRLGKHYKSIYNKEIITKNCYYSNDNKKEIICEVCEKPIKKNPCQLKLEKEGILGENCICEEEYYGDYLELVSKEGDLFVSMGIITEANLTIEEIHEINFKVCLSKDRKVCRDVFVKKTCIKAKIKTIQDMTCSELEALYPKCNPFSGLDCSKDDVIYQMVLKGC